MTKRIILFFFLFASFALSTKAQTTACSGTLSANSLTLYATYTQIGNGTTGSIQVCISSNSLGSGCMGCGDLVILNDANGGAYEVLWSSSTANGTCYTFATTTGYAYLAFQNCCGGNATITWQTVNGSGTNVCPSCSDGIQNGTETGVDCGGSCPACTGPCFNGIQDGTETGVDCGGTCTACGTCYDGIQNQTETGVDCGGPCMACTTNSGTVSSTCGACPTAVAATVYTTSCAQVGTSAYDLNSPAVSMEGCASFTAPSPAPTCGTASGYGTWVHVDLAAGTTQVQLAFDAGSIATGNSNCYAAAYQGTSCSALTAVSGGCQLAVAFNSGTYGVYQNFFTGLNPNQDLWIFMFNDNGKDFDLDFHLIGTASTPTNTGCGTAAAAAGEGCNLGASGATFTTPGAAGYACTGGNWGSNENTTYYSFTPTSSSATLSVSGISCNDGSAGSAQFGVWSSCAAIGTYTNSSTFEGCVVGSSNLTMTGLTAGNTYYIVVDGFAGDNCTWNFTGTNIILPVEIVGFKARYNVNKVDVSWTSTMEKNNKVYTVEKSADGIEFEPLAEVPGANNSSTRMNYSVVDFDPLPGTSYYRLKQTDFNGESKYSGIDIITLDETMSFNVVPNPTRSSAEVTFRCNEEDTYVLTVYDRAGQPVITREIACEKGQNRSLVDLAEYPEGMYLIVLTAGQKVYRTKLVKAE